MRDQLTDHNTLENPLVRRATWARVAYGLQDVHDRGSGGFWRDPGWSFFPSNIQGALTRCGGTARTASLAAVALIAEHVGTT